MAKRIRVKKRTNNIAYAGSLIQQSFGESIDKGYLMWDFSDKKEITHHRRFILNDWGFAKLNISRGETIEERIENLQFSNDKKKTKIRVVYEDYAENYSLERERYIRDLIRNKYGCQEINVTFEAIEKEEVDVLDGKEDKEENLGLIDLLTEWIEISENDIEDDLKNELIQLAKYVDSEIGIHEGLEKKNRINIVPLKLTISNIFSFPEKKLVIDFSKYTGTMGIFGENYSGKSNFIRAFVWSAFEVVPSNKDSNTIVNVYTPSQKGYTILELLINGVKHRITRQIEQKDVGSNSYKRKFEELIEYEEDGKVKEKWKPVGSDQTTSEQKEVKRQIEEAIGSYDDFSINSLHIHGSEDDYINLGQQDKNALFWKYNGLEPYKARVKYARAKINTFKRDHKDLGKTSQIQEEIKKKEQELKAKKITLESLEKEKKMNETKKDDENKKIINLTSKLEKIQVLPFDNKDDIEKKIQEVETRRNSTQKIHDELKVWIEENPKKELPFDTNKTIEGINFEIEQKEIKLEKLKKDKVELNDWLEKNPRKERVDDSGATQVIMNVQGEIIKLQDDLIIYQGKPCPTCGNATDKSDLNKENSTKLLIKEKNFIIEEKRKLIQRAEEAREHNNIINQKESKVSLFSSDISRLEGEIKTLKSERGIIEKSKGIIEHNALYDKKHADFKKAQGDLQNLNNSVTLFKNQHDIFDQNEENKKKNKEIERYIADVEEVITQYRLALSSVDTQIQKIIGEISVIESNIGADLNILDKIREADRNFKVYSLYLQAVERDGIPSMIIKRRLPLINSRINSMIGHIANFKVTLEVDKKGDIKEYFYFMEDMRDKLPVSGSGSGAQKFLVSLAIKDGLRYISGRFVVQPSILLIDEGFGTLHAKVLPEMINILSYLKTKYRNLVIITHVDEIKDSADHIFEASKDRSMISKEELSENENAGITKFIQK